MKELKESNDRLGVLSKASKEAWAKFVEEIGYASVLMHSYQLADGETEKETSKKLNPAINECVREGGEKIWDESVGRFVSFLEKRLSLLGFEKMPIDSD